MILGPPSYSPMNLMPLRSTALDSYDLARGLIQESCEPGYNY